MVRVKPTVNPLWMPQHKGEIGDAEIAFMSRYYDDVDGIVSAAEDFDWNSASYYRFRWEAGNEVPHVTKYWDHENQCWDKVRCTGFENEDKSGLIQRAFLLSAAQYLTSFENIFTWGKADLFYKQPLVLEGILDASCTLLWGSSFTYRTASCIAFDFQFLACGRQIRVWQTVEPIGRPNDLHVLLVNGNPLKEPWWGVRLDANTE